MVAPSACSIEVMVVHLDAQIQSMYRAGQGRINKCGGPVRKNVWGPPPPYAVESRIESKMVHPFNMDKRPTTILHEL